MMKMSQLLKTNSILTTFFMGLFSILVVFSIYLLKSIGWINLQMTENNIIWIVILISYPHFMASYYWFYGNTHLKSQNQIIGYLIPALLLSSLIFLFLTENIYLKNSLYTLALLLLFWHFVKQSFGCSMFLSQKTEKNETERNLLLSSYLMMGAWGFLNVQKDMGRILAFRTYVSTVQVDEIYQYASLCLSLFLFAIFIFKLRSKTNLKNLLMLSIPWLANLLWFTPWILRDSFALIPIFHALQYFPFLLTSLQTKNAAKFHLNMILILFLSCLFFLGLPWIFNQYTPDIAIFWSSALFVFLNVHHFMIDSVSWKLKNPDVRKYLIDI